MRKIIFSIFSVITLLMVVGVAISFLQEENRFEIQLNKCIDGDTAWFLINGKKQKVRFLGIDTPESTGEVIEDFGVEASDYTCSILKDADHIYLEYDEQSDRYDKYDRVLGWIFVDNNNLSELLLFKGYASVKYIYGDYKYIDKLCLAQENAYYEKIGIWSTMDSIPYLKNYCVKR